MKRRINKPSYLFMSSLAFAGAGLGWFTIPGSSHAMASQCNIITMACTTQACHFYQDEKAPMTPAPNSFCLLPGTHVSIHPDKCANQWAYSIWTNNCAIFVKPTGGSRVTSNCGDS